MSEQIQAEQTLLNLSRRLLDKAQAVRTEATKETDPLAAAVKWARAFTLMDVAEAMMQPAGTSAAQLKLEAAA